MCVCVVSMVQLVFDVEYVVYIFKYYGIGVVSFDVGVFFICDGGGDIVVFD